jgi:pilus assembly protein CpaB
MLALAVGCGLFAMLGVQQLLARKAGAQPNVVVLVAARDLQAEEVLAPDMVAVRKVLKSAAPAGSVSSYKDVEGRWVKLPMLAGEPIVDAKLAAKGEAPGLLGRIPQGQRAFAVEVNEQSGVSGFVLPDNHVDVILARSSSGKNGTTESHAETILQDIRVLAAGTETTRTEDKSIEVHTVTLAVTPEQVARLVAARAEGSLSLALRGQNSHEIVDMPRPTPEPEPKPEPKPEPAPPPVVVAQPPPVVVATAPVRRPVRIWHGPSHTFRSRPNPEIHDPGADAEAALAAARQASATPSPAPVAPTRAPPAPPTWEVPPPWAVPPYGAPATVPTAPASAMTAGLGPTP